jgi:peptidoglycan hydrolase-like protein with peptidoglycan-binding domain
MKRLLTAAAVATLIASPVAFAQTQTQNPQNPPPSSGTSSGDMSAGGGSMQGSDHTQATPDQVKQAQTELKSQGLYKGKIDGDAGPQTMKSLRAYQKEKGLQQTGMLDEQTMDSLTGTSGSSGQQQ